jgi:predicted RND superfamily exporter protein
VVVIPAILGLAIDSSIHLISSWTQNPDMTPRKLLDTTGRLVMASSITTIAGFAGALGISHKGLRTIGELAVSSISMFLLAAIIFTITLSFMLLKKEK